MESFLVIYDMQEAGFHGWDFVSEGFIVTVLGAVLLLVKKRLETPVFSGVFAWLPLVMFFGGLTWVSLLFAIAYPEFQELHKSYLIGKYKQIDGVVESYVRAESNPKGRVSFLVNGQRFSCSKYVIKPGYCPSLEKEAYFSEGVRVKIRYVDAAIVRLEVERDPEQAHSQPSRPDSEQVKPKTDHISSIIFERTFPHILQVFFALIITCSWWFGGVEQRRTREDLGRQYKIVTLWLIVFGLIVPCIALGIYLFQLDNYFFDAHEIDVQLLATSNVLALITFAIWFIFYGGDALIVRHPYYLKYPITSKVLLIFIIFWIIGMATDYIAY